MTQEPNRESNQEQSDREPLPPTLDDAALAGCLEAALRLNGIALEPQWRETVLVQFKALAGAARLVMEVPLDDEAEPAPVFSP